MTVHYRPTELPSNHVFPIPIHDTFKAFDYIRSTFTSETPHQSEATPRFALHGSHLGGALATSLALTEPGSIHALAVSEPIVDWVGLSEDEDNDHSEVYAKKIPTARSRLARDSARLLSVRDKLFRKPDDYFDPFASPVLFLRAPGRDCPWDVDYLASMEKRFSRSSSSSSSSQTSTYGPDDDDLDSHPSTPQSSVMAASEERDPYVARSVKRRKVLRRWPANLTPDSTLLPMTRVFVEDAKEGEEKVLADQGEELVDMMCKVCFWGREKGFAEERVTLQKLSGRVQGHRVDGILDVKKVARWLNEMFSQENRKTFDDSNN